MNFNNEIVECWVGTEVPKWPPFHSAFKNVYLDEISIKGKKNEQWDDFVCIVDGNSILLEAAADDRNK